MTKKKQLLITTVLLYVLSLVGPVVGMDIFVARQQAYYEKRKALGIEKENHYLGDLQEINRPALLGFGFGILSFAGAITANILFSREKKRMDASKVAGDVS